MLGIQCIRIPTFGLFALMSDLTSTIPIAFPVVLDDAPASVTLDFATHEDVIATTQ